MTGTAVLPGLGLADGHPGEAARDAGAVGAFLAGVVAARELRRLGHGRAPSLAVATALVAATSALPAILVTGSTVAHLLAFAMGMQNAAATRFGGVGLSTVFITGNLVRHRVRCRGQRLPAGEGPGMCPRLRVVGDAWE